MAFHLCSLPSGFKGIVAIQEATKARLQKTCFRGTHKNLAGNFAIFATIQDFLGDPKDSRIIRAILVQMQEILKGPKPFDEHSFEIEWGTPVGWSSTDALSPLYHDGVVERKKFGWEGKANALFVEPRHLLAPITSTITIAITLGDLKGVPHAIIRTIYPGKDVGELEGDITKREKAVFFDWNHPGAEIPKPIMALQGV